MTLVADAAYVLGTTVSGTVNLLDNEMPVVTVGVSDAWASEPGTDTGRFTVYRTGATTAALTVKYAMSGTAVNGTDYNLLSGSVAIAAWQRHPPTWMWSPRTTRRWRTRRPWCSTLSENATYQTGSAIGGTVNLLDDEVPIIAVAANRMRWPPSRRMPGCSRSPARARPTWR